MEKLPNSNSKPSSREVSTQELPMEDSMPTHKSAKENTTDNASKTGLKRKEVLRRMMKVAHPETGRILIGLSALIVNAITNLSFPNIMRQAVDQAAADTAVSDSVATVVSSWGSVGMFVMNNYFVVKAAGIFFIGSVASWIRVYYLGSAKERITGSLRLEFQLTFLFENSALRFSGNRCLRVTWTRTRNFMMGVPREILWWHWTKTVAQQQI